MTESEALTRWCPFARTGAYTDLGAHHAISLNRDPRPEVQQACLCIASACMMWQPTGPSSDRPEATWYESGYCGLMKS